MAIIPIATSADLDSAVGNLSRILDELVSRQNETEQILTGLGSVVEQLDMRFEALDNDAASNIDMTELRKEVSKLSKEIKKLSVDSKIWDVAKIALAGIIARFPGTI